jgi:hypothetical protein
MKHPTKASLDKAGGYLRIQVEDIEVAVHRTETGVVVDMTNADTGQSINMQFKPIEVQVIACHPHYHVIKPNGSFETTTEYEDVEHYCQRLADRKQKDVRLVRTDGTDPENVLGIRFYHDPLNEEDTT